MALHNSYGSTKPTNSGQFNHINAPEPEQRKIPKPLDLSTAIKSRRADVPKRILFDLVRCEDGSTFIDKKPPLSATPILPARTTSSTQSIPTPDYEESEDPTYETITGIQKRIPEQSSHYMPALSASCPSLQLQGPLYTTPHKNNTPNQSVTSPLKKSASAYQQPQGSNATHQPEQFAFIYPPQPPYPVHQPAQYPPAYPAAPYVYPPSAPHYQGQNLYPQLDESETSQTPYFTKHKGHTRQRSSSDSMAALLVFERKRSQDPLLDFVQKKEETIYEQLARLEHELTTIKIEMGRIETQPYEDPSTPTPKRSILNKIISTKAENNTKSFDKQDAERQETIKKLQQQRTKIAGQIGAIHQKLTESSSTKS